MEEGSLITHTPNPRHTHPRTKQKQNHMGCTGLGFDDVDASDIYTDDELDKILRGSVLKRHSL